MIIKRKEIVEIFNMLSKMKDRKGLPIDFIYTMAKNKKLLREEIDILREVERKPTEYMNYLSEKLRLDIKFSKRDKDGNPLKRGNGYLIDENRTEDYDNALNELVEKYEDVIEETTEKQKELEELLDGEIDIDFELLEKEKFPEDITIEEMETLLIFEKPIKKTARKKSTNK
jgi:hypothetical protein